MAKSDVAFFSGHVTCEPCGRVTGSRFDTDREQIRLSAKGKKNSRGPEFSEEFFICSLGIQGGKNVSNLSSGCISAYAGALPPLPLVTVTLVVKDVKDTKDQDFYRSPGRVWEKMFHLCIKALLDLKIF